MFRKFLIILVASVMIASSPVDARPAALEQEPSPLVQQDEQAEEPELVIRPIRHGTFALEYGETVIVVDPVADGDYIGLTDVTAVLITDIHPDHWDLTTAAMLMGGQTTVIGPKVVGDQWGGVDTVLANGEIAVLGEVSIEAVPMYNLERGPSQAQVFHPVGRGNGYVVTIGGKRVYISGDTECTPEMRALENIDIAFVCMNLPYTMAPSEAAECVKAFRPGVVYPYHYRGSDLDVFSFRMQDAPEIEVRRLDWYPRR